MVRIIFLKVFNMSKILFFVVWSEIRFECFGFYWYFFEKFKDDIVLLYVRGLY